MSKSEQLSMKADEHLDALFKVGSVSREKASKILSKIESNPGEEKYQNLNHANIAQKFGTRRKILAAHDRLRLRNNNVELFSQKLAAKIEAHEAELKREKLRVIAQNKQRLASKPEQNLLHIGWRAKVRCAVKDKNRFAMSGWFELFRGKSSIYALDEVSKKWVHRGISGQVIMFQNQQFRTDIRIKWSKNQRYPIWWRLMNGKPKPKGEHWDTQTWVLKAWDTQTNKQEILAIRFSDAQLSQQFSVKFHKLQMSLAKQGIFNVGASVSDRKGTGSGVNSLGV